MLICFLIITKYFNLARIFEKWYIGLSIFFLFSQIDNDFGTGIFWFFNNFFGYLFFIWIHLTWRSYMKFLIIISRTINWPKVWHLFIFIWIWGWWYKMHILLWICIWFIEFIIFLYIWVVNFLFYLFSLRFFAGFTFRICMLINYLFLFLWIMFSLHMWWCR